MATTPKPTAENKAPAHVRIPAPLFRLMRAALRATSRDGHVTEDTRDVVDRAVDALADFQDSRVLGEG